MPNPVAIRRRVPTWSKLIRAGLVGYWKLDENTGTVANDSSGKGNNGTYNGTTASTNVPPAIKFYDPRSRSFNGTSDYVSFGSIGPQSAFTLSVWIRDTGINSKETGYFGILGNDGFLYNGWGLYRDSTAAGIPSLSITGSFNARLTAISAINDGNWHHVAGTYDGTTAKIYVNGVLQNSAAKTAGSFGSNTGILGASAATTDNLSGALDDARIYNRVLSAAEIAQIAAGTG